jgi:hypothetical protein
VGAALSTCRSAATSANDLPAPSSVAFSPVKACQRSTATSMYAGSISSAKQERPVISAAMIVVPDPLNGS